MDRLVRGAAAIGAAALIAGCSLMTPIQTAELYNAGDGVRAEVGDGVRVENVMILAAEEGGEGHVFGALVNDTRAEVVIGLSVAGGGIEMPVGPGESILLGVDEPVIIPAVPAGPGSLVQATVTAAGFGTVPANVPVLDDTLAQYADYMP